MIPAATVEAVVLAVLRDHYKGPGYIYGSGWKRDNPGRWSCACGAHGDLARGDSVTEFHRHHVAAVMAQALTGGVADE